eukprot:TRINITY_DN2954_c0_g1_i2.p1 TRINITY_DN2954_c0_g1~~TRINITY_DN2954_c0_g1_i2.p1  ORF type:complete len:145 (+),score=53.79 TRINITY_DN2954_c0_g1_i2:363-797(+)
MNLIFSRNWTLIQNSIQQEQQEEQQQHAAASLSDPVDLTQGEEEEEEEDIQDGADVFRDPQALQRFHDHYIMGEMEEELQPEEAFGTPIDDVDQLVYFADTLQAGASALTLLSAENHHLIASVMGAAAQRRAFLEAQAQAEAQE